MPPESRGGALGLLASVTGGGSGGGAGVEDALAPMGNGGLYIAILRSESVQIRIIDRFDLRSVYHTKRMVDTVEKLAKNVAVAEDRRLGTIALSVTDHDPNRAAQMGNAYVEELDAALARLNTSAASREKDFLEKQLDLIRKQLTTAEHSQADFSSKNATLDLKEQGRVLMEAAARIETELVAAEAELNSLKAAYGDSHVRVRAAGNKVERLRKELNAMGGVGPGGESLADGNLPSIRKLPGLGMSYADLYRQTRILEAVYELLTKQYELAKVQEAKEVKTVRVLDPARVPERKSEPKRTAIVIVSTFLAALAGLVWIVAAWYWSRVDDGDPAKTLIRRIAGEVRMTGSTPAPQS
jgi:uncharacterized protein involved in exopolysaccharide biosynthesis